MTSAEARNPVLCEAVFIIVYLQEIEIAEGLVIKTVADYKSLMSFFINGFTTWLLFIAAIIS